MVAVFQVAALQNQEGETLTNIEGYDEIENTHLSLIIPFAQLVKVGLSKVGVDESRLGCGLGS